MTISCYDESLRLVPHGMITVGSPRVPVDSHPKEPPSGKHVEDFDVTRRARSTRLP